MMITTRMSTKGQVIIPKAVRDQLGAQPGTEYAVEIDRGAIRLVPRSGYKSRLPATTIDDVAGCLIYNGPQRPMAELRETARRMVGKTFKRSGA
jgi:AbrB family looped-hinge helix DNA binding protein